MDAKLFAGDTAGLNINQKKKLRKKRTKFYKKLQGAAVEAAASPAASPSPAASSQPCKRARLDPESSQEGEAAGACTAEPVQSRAHLSGQSLQQPPLAAAAGDSVTHTAAAQCSPSQARGMEGEDAVTGICRVDLTHAALLIHAHFNGGPSAAPTSAGAPAVEPAGSALALALEATASANHFDSSSQPGSCDREGEEEDVGPAAQRSSSAPDFAPGAASSHAPQAAASSTAPSATVVAARDGGRVYLHGNYHRYYGYRLGQGFQEDPRLGVLERRWFAGRRCMDVGCNEGLVTLSIAAKFGVRSMVGVDIDEHLIRRACTHLRDERSRACLQSAASRRGGVSGEERRIARRTVAALAQTWFVHGDFVLGQGEAGSVDTLTALSVTKWVHLHCGDAGMRAFFAKVFTLLAPGGRFILEPQPWRSYIAGAAKIRRKVESAPVGSYFHNPQQLQLRPESFSDVLCEEFGFMLVKRLQPPADAAAGFDRTVYLFRKPS